MMEKLSDSVHVPLEPLTEEETNRRLEAIERALALREAILARRGGQPLRSSWPLIRRGRLERS